MTLNKSTLFCVCCDSENSFKKPHLHYYECVKCGLYRNEPFPSQQMIMDYYNLTAKSGNYNIDKLPQYDSWRKTAYREAYEKLSSCVTGGLSGSKVLDVGCLTGLSLEVIKENGAEPFGIELQEEAAKFAEKKFPNKVFACDICHEVPIDEKFKAITLTDVIEHLPFPLEAIKNLTNKLENRGYLLLTTPNTSSLSAKLLGRFWPSRCSVHHIYLFNIKNIKLFLEKNGFEVLFCCALKKKYPLDYLIWVLPNLSPTLGKLASLIPRIFRRFSLYLSGGDVIIVARKKP